MKSILFVALILSIVIYPAFGAGIDLSNLENVGFKNKYIISTDGQDFKLYLTANFLVKSHEFIKDDKMLKFNVETGMDEDNKCEIYFPRNFLDGSFTTLLNGKEVSATVTKTDTIVYIGMKFDKKGDHTIEIIGTKYLTEFNREEFTDQLTYKISGGLETSQNSVEKIFNTPDDSLLFKLDAKHHGSLVITLPDDILTAFDDGTYFVTIDHEEVLDYKQDGNTLTIPFRAGDRDIEIFGSYVIPEFGTIVTILTLSVIMTLLISKKFPRVFSI